MDNEYLKVILILNHRNLYYNTLYFKGFPVARWAIKGGPWASEYYRRVFFNTVWTFSIAMGGI